MPCRDRLYRVGSHSPINPFPWTEAMGFGFGVLHLAPDVFWRMTLRELAQAIHAVRGPITAM